jgi:hypothetical protein
MPQADVRTAAASPRDFKGTLGKNINGVLLARCQRSTIN